MKKNRILYVVLAILGAIASYFYLNNKSGTIDEMEGAKSDFAIEDTASIDKIFITDAQGKSVTLTKSENTWMVNGKYDARPDNIRLLMKTFSRIDVKSPVPKAAFNNIVKSLATGAIKVEIYQGEDLPGKTYYVGGATMDNQGTYMLLETEGVKSTVPFIMYIPGFTGYLTTRFFTEPEQWRDAVVFRYLPEDIQSIEVNYFETPNESCIINNDKGKYSLLNFDTKEMVSNVDTSQLRNYVERYQKIYYEMVDIESSKEKIDSIVASSPFFSIKIKDVNGKSNKLVAYHMPNFRKLLDKDGEEFSYDVDRMYGYLNDEIFIYIQFATFDQITLPKKYFLNKKI